MMTTRTVRQGKYCDDFNFIIEETETEILNNLPKTITLERGQRPGPFEQHHAGGNAGLLDVKFYRYLEIVPYISCFLGATLLRSRLTEV